MDQNNALKINKVVLDRNNCLYHLKQPYIDIKGLTITISSFSENAINEFDLDDLMVPVGIEWEFNHPLLAQPERVPIAGMKHLKASYVNLCSFYQNLNDGFDFIAAWWNANKISGYQLLIDINKDGTEKKCCIYLQDGDGNLVEIASFDRHHWIDENEKVCDLKQVIEKFTKLKADAKLLQTIHPRKTKVYQDHNWQGLIDANTNERYFASTYDEAAIIYNDLESKGWKAVKLAQLEPFVNHHWKELYQMLLMDKQTKLKQHPDLKDHFLVETKVRHYQKNQDTKLVNIIKTNEANSIAQVIGLHSGALYFNQALDLYFNFQDIPKGFNLSFDLSFDYFSRPVVNFAINQIVVAKIPLVFNKVLNDRSSIENWQWSQPFVLDYFYKICDLVAKNLHVKTKTKINNLHKSN